METMIINQQTEVEFDEQLENTILAVANAAAKLQNLSPGTELSILLVDNAYIKKLNSMYRGQNVATDVLSFAMNELGEDEPDLEFPGEPNILGDIVISMEKAQSQSEEYGHSLAREIGFLTAHGILHLLGFEHDSDTGETVMQDTQEKILQSVNLGRK